MLPEFQAEICAMAERARRGKIIRRKDARKWQSDHRQKFAGVVVGKSALAKNACRAVKVGRVGMEDCGTIGCAKCYGVGSPVTGI